MSNVLNVPAAIGTEAFIAALGLAGANQAGAAVVTLPVISPGRGVFTAKPSGSLFTLPEIVGGSGTFASTSPGTTTWTLPTLAQLGYTWAFGASLEIPVMRQGLGVVYVNPAICRGTVGSQSAMLALLGASTGDFAIRSDLSNQVFILTGTAADSNGQLASTLSNWTSVPLGQANAPTAAGVVIEDPFGLAPSLLPQWGRCKLVLVGADHWAVIP